MEISGASFSIPTVNRPRTGRQELRRSDCCKANPLLPESPADSDLICVGRKLSTAYQKPRQPQALFQPLRNSSFPSQIQSRLSCKVHGITGIHATRGPQRVSLATMTRKHNYPNAAPRNTKNESSEPFLTFIPNRNSKQPLPPICLCPNLRRFPEPLHSSSVEIASTPHM